ncbi:MAG: RDD family protein [Actinomycetota bacterium]|nr:RDD family protein [Actinomycetota bacterium]
MVGRRVVAYLVDSLVYAVLGGALWFALTDHFPASRADTTSGGFTIGDTRYGFTDSGKRTVWLIAIIILAVVLFIIIPGLKGKSPGRWLTGISIVKRDGGPPGIGRQIVRQLLWIVDSFPFANLVGFITALASKHNQRVGDMVART